jgi:hypothetical protein
MGGKSNVPGASSKSLELCFWLSHFSVMRSIELKCEEEVYAEYLTLPPFSPPYRAIDLLQTFHHALRLSEMISIQLQ